MKIVLLAGGIGSRARPFSDYSPKALIPINGKPLIDYIIKYVSKFPPITEIIIVCEFDSHGKQIINYLEGKERIIGKKITFIEDRKKRNRWCTPGVYEKFGERGFLHGMVC